MYAIIVDGGRQYRVEQGQELDIDYRDPSKKGDKLTFDRVLLVGGGDSVKIGKPTLAGVSVSAEVVGPVKGDKIWSREYRKRKNYRRRKGHRQLYTKVRIESIAGA